MSKTHVVTLENIDLEGIRKALISCGAVMIKSEQNTLEDFVSLSDELMLPMIHHATNTIERDPLGEDPKTATVNKGVEAIPLHREGSYAPGCPDLLMFFCETPASKGGETIICDGAKLLEAMKPSTREFVENAELHWSWEAQPVRWKQTLRASNIDEANKKLAYLKDNLKDFESLEYRFEGDVLHGKFITRAVIPALYSGTPSFCNSLMIHAYRPKSDYFARDDFRVLLSNGEPFPADMLAEIRELAEEVCADISWNPKEIVIIDNSRLMHARRNFEDINRRILLRMGHVKH